MGQLCPHPGCKVMLWMVLWEEHLATLKSSVACGALRRFTGMRLSDCIGNVKQVLTDAQALLPGPVQRPAQ